MHSEVRVYCAGDWGYDGLPGGAGDGTLQEREGGKGGAGLTEWRRGDGWGNKLSEDHQCQCPEQHENNIYRDIGGWVRSVRCTC